MNSSGVNETHYDDFAISLPADCVAPIVHYTPSLVIGKTERHTLNQSATIDQTLVLGELGTGRHWQTIRIPINRHGDKHLYYLDIYALKRSLFHF